MTLSILDFIINYCNEYRDFRDKRQNGNFTLGRRKINSTLPLVTLRPNVTYLNPIIK